MTMQTPRTEDTSLPPLRLAMCQIESRHWDVEGNTNRTMAALEEAAMQRAELAVTPEAVLQGYPAARTGTERDRLWAMADTVDSPRLQQIRGLCKERRMAVAVGFVERTEEGKLHNACALFDASGELLLHYRKVHCRPFESTEHDGFYTPGKSFEAAPLQTPGGAWMTGICICFDREIPESLRCLRAAGAELVLCPLATNTRQFADPATRADNELLTQARSAENELFIVVVNHAGIYNGGSFVTGPSGEVLVQMSAGPGVQTIEVPVGVVRERFHSDPWGWAGWGYRRPDVYDSRIGTSAVSVDCRENTS